MRCKRACTDRRLPWQTANVLPKCFTIGCSQCSNVFGCMWRASVAACYTDNMLWDLAMVYFVNTINLIHGFLGLLLGRRHTSPTKLRPRCVKDCMWIRLVLCYRRPCNVGWLRFCVPRSGLDSNVWRPIFMYCHN